MEGPVRQSHRNVLIVDDEPAIREMIAFSLERSGMTVNQASDQQEALESITNDRPDLILMDWMLPGTSGLQFTRRLRKESFTKDIPIIMLTARVAEDDRVAGLKAGADDYVIKPFSPRELLARIEAVLRRVAPACDEGKITAGNLKLDSLTRRVTCRGFEIHLRPLEYRILEFFMRNPDLSVSRSQLLDNVWGANTYLEERTVDVHIRRLRKALEKTGCHKYVETVRGHGYRFIARK